MPVSSSRRLFHLTPLVVLLGLRLCAASPWPEVRSDLQPDPKALWGNLPNGLRYVILPNTEPKDRISIRLLVAVGSLHERDDERGVAHFVEHMVYRGTRSHPGNKLNKMLESKGIGTGPDSNAFTSYDSTVYYLDLPNARDATLRLGLETFREYAEEVRFDGRYLSAERGVILSEKATRAKPEYILGLNNFAFLWTDSLQARRVPIGTDPVIKNCTRDQLVAFYDAWYRPERMAVIVVGDLAADRVESMIREIFGPLRARAPAREEPTDMAPRAASNADIFVYKDQAQIGVTLTIEHPSPSPRMTDSHPRRVKDLHLALALTMLQNRLEKFARGHEGTFIAPRVAMEYPAREWQNVAISAGSTLDNWQRAAADLEQEHRRAFVHGFSNDELRIAKANFAATYEQSVRSAASRPSAWLAAQLVGCLLYGSVFATPETLQRDLAADLDAATITDCRAAFRDAWSTRPPHVLVAAHTDFSARAVDVAEVLNKSRQIAIDAPADQTTTVFAYTDFGPPGRVVRDEHLADLDVRLAELSNGVRINFKPTSFVADTIDIYVRVGIGKLSQPADQPGLDLLANAALTGGGLHRHTAQEMRDLLAGHALAVSFGIDTDACVFTGRCARGELLLCLQVISAYLSDSAYRPEIMTEARASLASMYASIMASPGGPITQQATRIVSGGDARFGIPEPDVLFARNLTELAEWLEPQFKRDPIECAIVGDCTWKEAAEAAVRTLGALPDRQPRANDSGDMKVYMVPSKPEPYVFQISPTNTQVALAWFWPITGPVDTHRERRYVVLGDLVAERLRVRIREELGATYAPSVALVQYEGFPHFNYLTAYVEMPPLQLSEVSRIVNEEMNTLRFHRVSNGEFRRVKQPRVRARDDDTHTNLYWLHTVLRDAQQRPERLAAARDRVADFEAINSKEIQALAKQCLDPGQCSVFIATPSASILILKN